MGINGGVATNWIYISENFSLELRQDPKDQEQDQYRATNVYSRFRVVDGGTSFFYGQTQGTVIPTNGDSIKSYTGTLEIPPQRAPGASSTFTCVGDTFELLEVGSNKVKETQTWRNVGSWVDLG